MEFLLATGNAHKAEEFSELFDTKIIQIKAASEKIEVVEDGSNFNENALLKAEAYYQKYKTPVISDDSGIVVDALPGELGLYSARFGGEGLTGRQRSELLLEKMKEESNRNAYFICVLCCYLNPGEVFFFEGRMEGEVATQYVGEHGFGYDPVFIPKHHEGQDTVAMLPEWKKANSHRAKACIAAQSFFDRQNS